MLVVGVVFTASDALPRYVQSTSLTGLLLSAFMSKPNGHQAFFISVAIRQPVTFDARRCGNYLASTTANRAI